MNDRDDLLRKAARFVELAAEARDPDVRASLLALAADFEAEAEAEGSGPRPVPPGRSA